MYDGARSKRTETDRKQNTLRKPTVTKQPIQLADARRLPLYAQAWGNRPPPWLRLSSSLQTQREQPVQRQMENVQQEQSPQEEQDVLVSIEEPSPLQRREATRAQFWGNRVPLWLRLSAAPHEREIAEPLQRKENTTGLPDRLKNGVEGLSGLSLDDVQVHYHSSKPARLQALAYTQGSQIHVGPGQEQHLAHEAWHVVQQKQGRVQPTLQAKGVAINDDTGLEREADVMGTKAMNSRVQRKADACNCAGACICGGQVEFEEPPQQPSHFLASRMDIIQPMSVHHPLMSSAGVIQMRQCSDGVDWSTRQPGQNAAALRLSGMLVEAEEAHILCCAFCKAQIQSLTTAGPLAAYTRFTALFRHYVPQEEAAANLPATTTLHLEESYFIGVNNANDRILDNGWWAAIRAILNAGFFTGAGVYPVGLPPAAQANFDQYQALGPIVVAPGLPPGRRSYNLLAVVLFSGIYTIAKFLEDNPPVAAGGLAPAATPWGLLRAAAGGHARSSDVTIDRAVMGAPTSSILDAKFSYIRGGYDIFHGNQQADLLRAHQALPGAGAGAGGVPPGNVAALTIGTCSCDRDLIESQKRASSRSKTFQGPDQVATRTRGGEKRIREEFERQSETRKQLRYVE